MPNINSLDLAVGIPSYNEADNIDFVVRQVAAGLERYFPHLNTEHEARYSQVSDKRWHGKTYSTKIAEVKDPDGPDGGKELPVGEDRGFLWRLYAYWRLEEAEDGVFVECLSVSLSRRIPFGLGWIVKPFVSSMPRESLEGTLQATRVAVRGK